MASLLPEGLPPSRAVAPAGPGRDRWWVGLPLLLALVAYAGSLDGDFVYDDRKQILDNHLIQEPRHLGRALASDVWAFKGERPEAWSNYWRPLFVLWLAGNQALFGTGSTLPWHAANLGLHLLAVALVFRLACRLGMPPPAAAGVAVVFAVHPAHVESVAWISGAPDLLAAVAMLGSLLCVFPGAGSAGAGAARSGTGVGRLVAALGLAALALLAKEMAVVLPALVLVAVAALDRAATPRQRLGRGLRASLPFAGVAALFFLARWAVLGRVEIETPWSTGPLGLLLTIPSLLAFYLRQSLLPLDLGPSYPLRAVTLGSLGVADFWLPLAAVGASAALAARLARRRPAVQVGLALFVLPLLPALNVDAFLPEQLVHDRYLYLPLAGFWLALLAVVGDAAARRWPARPRRAALASFAAALLVALPMAAQTWRYCRVWGSELRLWERGVAVDPASAFNFAQYGHALAEAGRREEALAALDRALARAPVAQALLDRAALLAGAGRPGEAERDLLLVSRYQPDNPVAWERLAALYQQQGRGAEAAAALRAGREAVPYRRCAFSSNLAVVLYQAGLKAEALAELEAAREWVGREATAACSLAQFHLGSLYLELGRRQEARAAFERFLEVSRRSPGLGPAREVARRMLEGSEAP